MSMKRRSIRYKFFIAISAVALVFIGVLILLNLFFYEDYYMLTRRNELRDAYQSIRSSYNGDMEQMLSAMDSYESQTAIRMAVVSSDGRYIPPCSPRMIRRTKACCRISTCSTSSAAAISSCRPLRRRSTGTPWAPGLPVPHVTLRDNEQYLCLAGSLDSQPANACSPICPMRISSRTPRSTCSFS